MNVLVSHVEEQEKNLERTFQRATEYIEGRPQDPHAIQIFKDGIDRIHDQIKLLRKELKDQ